MTKSLSGAPRVALGLVLAACAGAAVAQQGPIQVGPPRQSSSNGIQEVIVTALKRDTSLQETPHLDQRRNRRHADQFRRAGHRRLTQAVPGLVFEDNGPTATRITIRGIRSVGEPTVGLYYDETPRQRCRRRGQRLRWRKLRWPSSLTYSGSRSCVDHRAHCMDPGRWVARCV